MHYFASILAVFIFVIALLPCTDGGVHIDIHTDHIEDHGHSHDHQGDCPPFCTCGCCGVVVSEVPVFIFWIERQFTTTVTTEFHYSFHYSHQHPTIVWQPPTVS